MCFFFFFQAEDGIRDLTVTGVQTCALPISCNDSAPAGSERCEPSRGERRSMPLGMCLSQKDIGSPKTRTSSPSAAFKCEIGRAACRGRGEISGGAGSLKKKKKKKG